MQIQAVNFFAEVIRNKIIWASFCAWLVAQGIKVLNNIIKEKRFDFKWIIGTGGMPSAHSAGVCALGTAVGLVYGFDNGIFAATAIFAVIIMSDAQGVRRMTGHQAEALNRIIDDIYRKKGIQEERLRELIGHTPVEVIMGAFLGIIVALFIMTI
ncbi:MAG: divergent PAP2 family protein [Gammaproteobacteria bacterium]|nr:divergent PAP2 family protein [Gammaproteobacteria bacterium]